MSRTISKRQTLERWPALPLAEWKETCETLHMWTQIVGKIRMALSPHVNHWWEVPLYVTARGLTTSPIPCEHGAFEIQFDFIEQRLVIGASNGGEQAIPLVPRTVADFYQELMARLQAIGIKVRINTMPQEVEHPIPFEQDRVHASYDPSYARRFWNILVQVDRVMKEFRAQFLGKVSPVHFFWGSFDMAVTRFSGRPAPERAGADAVTQEAYSHEVSSCGFWPGGGKFTAPAFYSYASPEPDGFKSARVHPDAAYYDSDLSEFVLKYDDIRQASQPEQLLMGFFESTYQAEATLAHWDKALVR